VSERRKTGRARSGAAWRVAGAVAAIGRRLWVKAVRHPVDSTAILLAGVVSVVIIVNAVFLQAGSHRAPFVANPTLASQVADSRPDVAAAAMPKAVDAPAHPPVNQRAPQSVAPRRNDPIGDLIGSSFGPPNAR
jgi:hypothetical protein